MKANGRQLFFKWFIVLFVIGIIFFSMMFYAIYSLRTNILIDNIIKSEQRVINLHRLSLEKSFWEITSDLNFISKNIRLNDYLSEPSENEKLNLKAEWLLFAKSKEIYDQIRYFNLSGQEVIRINYNSGKPYIVDETKLQNKSKRYYFKDTVNLSKNEVFVSPFDLNIENGQIEQPLKSMIRFGAPVFDSSGKKHGVIVLNYLGNHLINNLVKLSKDMIGRNLMLNSEGYFIIGLNKKEEWGFMYNNNKRMENRFPNAWQEISKKKSGIIKHKSGHFIFKTVTPLLKKWKPDSESVNASEERESKTELKEYYWKILSYISPAEIVNIKKDLVRTYTILYLIIIALFTVLVGFLSKYIVQKKLLLNEKKKNDEQREKLVIDLTDSLKNIKTLSGLIPICASCKKVRNDEGYWNDIELYVENHSDAQFSHGICKTCEVKLYGEEEWYKKRDSKTVE